jgi:hypothetical protein
MFPLPILLLVIAVMTVVHISIFQIFPRGMRDVIMSNPLFAFLIDLCGTSFIEHFTGTAMFVGIANLAASVMFIGYALWYKHHFKIKGLKVHWLKIIWVVPIFPVIKAIKE